MSKLTEKYIRLKTAVGGNREITGYEDTFGMPREAQAHITPPGQWNERILCELNFALELNDDGRYDAVIDQALDSLLAKQAQDGALCDNACLEAEKLLLPLTDEAKSYRVLLAAHAHIDMNWMWSYPETVASTLATFRTLLTLMEAYPDFCFSQSQAAVYRIVEEHDPKMMEEIKKRIAEGRWEVTATAWVEADHNMPNTESMLRHIEYTREYLSSKWGVTHFDIDFSPDTFGHNANLPEIDTFANVKYFYHCRGLKEDVLLYRYRACSGKELLAYREPFWYNASVTPRMGIAAPKIARRCGGLKTSLAIYGVGDHGGGPTRRDLERALDMMQWPVFPTMTFGKARDYFLAAESVRDQLPVIEHEVNFFAPGCYTTQSRIKRGNRRMEVALTDAEAYGVAAQVWTAFTPRPDALRSAWQNVLFTHFHDILTGSCVQDTREHAMGLYQQSSAVANTQCTLALQAICASVDTSAIITASDKYHSQSEGAGVGYNVENYSGMPCPERGGGLTRIFHVFNPLAEKRTAVVELTVWDWLGDLKRVCVAATDGTPLPCQVLDEQLQPYWDHKFFRILTDVEVPALGYTTLVLTQKEADAYPLHFQSGERCSATFEDFVLENGCVRAVLNAESGRVTSLRVHGEELVAGNGAGFTFVETECATSNAWQIGRHIRELAVDQCVELKWVANGALRQSLCAKYQVGSSTMEVTYTLDRGADAVRMDATVDWHEIGGKTIPVLDYRVPLAYCPKNYLYDIAGGFIRRPAIANDVPALQYGLAEREGAPCALLASDCKYGYRGTGDILALTLINSSTSPDPYPERGIHHFALSLGGCAASPAAAERAASCLTHGLTYQSGTSHAGSLPTSYSLLELDAPGIAFSALTLDGEDAFRLRVYDANGQGGTAKVRTCRPIAEAVQVNALNMRMDQAVVVDGSEVTFSIPKNGLAELRIRLLAH
ncbi:MAG TPA: glycoside hydrolase family 38 C-terminal domain-containing protein [Candidatus Limiplasma sp.]|nr:glycoside hydrolase family 38 C-terminal domain-containing protein [Candidatus Limiplasma sp.]